MEAQFQVLHFTRKNYLWFANLLSLDQLNYIPEGYNNSIAWNMGHALVTQQLLFYRQCGLESRVEQALIDKYRRGTKPDLKASAEEMERIKFLLMDTEKTALADYQNGLFKPYQPLPFGKSLTLTTIEDAIAFNNFHEGLHLGYIMAMKKRLPSPA